MYTKLYTNGERMHKIDVDSPSPQWPLHPKGVQPWRVSFCVRVPRPTTSSTWFPERRNAFRPEPSRFKLPRSVSGNLNPPVIVATILRSLRGLRLRPSSRLTC